MKNMNKVVSLMLALCAVSSMALSSMAAEINHSGGSATTPVNLTTTNGGLDGDDSDIAATKLNVVVPTSLPMAMADDGTVVTATDCKIQNKSYGAVRVKSVTISAAEDWHLTKYGPKTSLAAEKVDANKLGFAMTIGNGAQVQTNSDEATQRLITSPVAGCYMTGIGDTVKSAVAIDYDAIITPMSGTVSDTTVANVMFVVEWDVA